MFFGCGPVEAGRAHAAEPQMSQPRAPGNLAASVEEPPSTHRCDALAGLVEHGEVGSAQVDKGCGTWAGKDHHVVPPRRRPEFG